MTTIRPSSRPGETTNKYGAADGASSGSPLVSIVINNYNYERFLGEAIDSALDQTYPNTEVIVVDDGSTDGSREIIEGYGERVVAVFKSNGGQGSAFNTGFAASRGEVVIFLDSDDVLLDDAVQRTVELFREHPRAAKVQHKMQVIDAEGERADKLFPSPRWQMPGGDLRRHILKFRSHVHPPNSGNAFAASALRRILPVPEGLYRINADAYVNDLCPVMGPVVSSEEVAALYRVHGNNNYCSIRHVDLPRLRHNLLATAYNRAEQERLLETVCSIKAKGKPAWDVNDLTDRIVSLKLEPQNHPFEERLPSLSLRGIISSFVFPGMRPPRRVLHALWFVVMLLSPRFLAASAATALLFPETRKQYARNLFTLPKRVLRGKASSASETGS